MEERFLELEAEGLTTSDAQAVIEAENKMKIPANKSLLYAIQTDDIVLKADLALKMAKGDVIRII